MAFGKKKPGFNFKRDMSALTPTKPSSMSFGNMSTKNKIKAVGGSKLSKIK